MSLGAQDLAAAQRRGALPISSTRRSLVPADQSRGDGINTEHAAIRISAWKGIDE